MIQPVAPTPSALLSVIGVVLLLLVPPIIVLHFSPASGIYLIVGAVSWSIALVFKLLLMRSSAVRTMVARGYVGAASWGLVSSVSELGSTAALLAIMQAPFGLVDGVAIGLGVGSTEVLFVLAMAIREHIRGENPKSVEEWIAGARVSLMVRHMFFIERLSATVGHVGTRGLVVYAMTTGRAWTATLALISFAIVDGVAIYGRSREWNWCSPQIARRFYTLALAVSMFELLLLLSLWVYSPPASSVG
ncbi:MAG: hypothetical protein Q7U97_05310 [Rhodocyclaceae bacterium]|nr:hypothetical protein [Rhodocyclaceae bacterium]